MKGNVNFKIYYITTWLTNNYLKHHGKNEAGRLVADLLLFVKKALYEIKTSGLKLSLIYFDSPQLGIQ